MNAFHNLCLNYLFYTIFNAFNIAIGFDDRGKGSLALAGIFQGLGHLILGPRAIFWEMGLKFQELGKIIFIEFKA